MKKITKILVYVILGLVILVLGLIGLSKYAEWKFDRETDLLRIEQEKPYLEDTYGGATPKETLDLFIAAVEKEDFDLASKYFVISRQGEWKDKLNAGKENNNISWFLEELKKIDEKMEYKDPTPELNGSDNYYVGNEMVITFVKYPRGIWKIKEI